METYVLTTIASTVTLSRATVCASCLVFSVERWAVARHCLILRQPGRAIKGDFMISLIDFKSYVWNQAITLAYHA